eukprot:CAMPEP_0181327986 /NCGR_PEP_ID=MMETSP1101-20121128/22434_1 /TAXON_ID=46948 /ORGANISM="Rhodomonas abbreviata, Strain Caron Lab Isolate" /LENGTH=227 /DNA_ID=CAMNT_0023436763 /DNA_START=11 /DNA_END=694 /DNA_ORIENTATION=+
MVPIGTAISASNVFGALRRSLSSAPKAPQPQAPLSKRSTRSTSSRTASIVNAIAAGLTGLLLAYKIGLWAVVVTSVSLLGCVLALKLRHNDVWRREGNPRRPRFVRVGGPLFDAAVSRRHLALMMRSGGADFGPDDYEALLGLDADVAAEGKKSRPLSELDACLPPRVLTTRDRVTDRCAVCLEHVKPGDSVRDLNGCAHGNSLHSDCLAAWLEHSHACPLCKADVF